jgi:hypothetical protein
VICADLVAVALTFSLGVGIGFVIGWLVGVSAEEAT